MLKHIKAQPDWDQKGLGAKGFTLIELLVVIVILGILAAVVVFAVSGIQDRGQESACRTDARTLRTAVEAYRAENSPTAVPTQTQLVNGGFLSEESTYYDLDYTGTTIDLSAADSRCA